MYMYTLHVLKVLTFVRGSLTPFMLTLYKVNR